MNQALVASLFLVVQTSTRSSSALAAATAQKRNPAVSLRGGPVPGAPLALARLDPGWWKVTTTAQVPKPVFSNKSSNATPVAGSAGAAGATKSIFDVQVEMCTPFLKMPGTFVADIAYWKKECKSVPAGTTYIKMTMGAATDYFRPPVNTTMCDMLTSGSRHLWSSDRTTWAKPNASTVGLGGSADGWPSKLNPNGTDQRSSLGFWGVNGTQTGGCCEADYTSASKSWAKPYTMEYCGLPKALAPVCTPLVTVAGSFSADKAFWAQTCKDIPMTASYVKVAMDGLVDYFKPPTGKSFCEMLTASDVHKWSKDGYKWVTPSTYATGSGLGGSANKAVNTSDARTNVSFWGSNQALETGGCCYASPVDKAPGYGKSFTMSYCTIATAPPVAQLVQMLHQEEASVEKMEDEMANFHNRLLAAEGVNIAASGNVSLANSGMYKLAIKAKNEADELKLISVRSSMLKTSLDGAETSLKGAQDAVRKASKKASGTAAVANKTASPQGLKAQDDLNSAVWKLMDPKNTNSLDATEKRVKAMEKETDAFRKDLAGQVKTVMVTKLRRTVRRLRKAIHRLGSAARSSAGRLGEVEGDTSLGADLGFDG